MTTPKWLRIKHQLQFFEQGYDAGYYDIEVMLCDKSMYRFGYEAGWMDRYMELDYKHISETHEELTERRKIIHDNDLLTKATQAFKEKQDETRSR